MSCGWAGKYTSEGRRRSADPSRCKGKRNDPQYYGRISIWNEAGRDVSAQDRKRSGARQAVFQARTRDSVIRIWRAEEVEKLKTLSPRIVVLRTMNIRVDDLESEIRGLTYELDALKAARKEN